MRFVNGQSGAGMLPPYFMPGMSFSALRIVRLSRRCHELLMHPQASPHYDRQLFELNFDLRLLAADYISTACQDLDLLALRSRVTAAGRRFSELGAGRGFSQAGVVAPPESPTDGISSTLALT